MRRSAGNMRVPESVLRGHSRQCEGLGKSARPPAGHVRRRLGRECRRASTDRTAARFPWSSATRLITQGKENDDTRNEFIRARQRISDTYIRQPPRRRTSVYDMYTRFFRWARDRLTRTGHRCLRDEPQLPSEAADDGFRKRMTTRSSRNIRHRRSRRGVRTTRERRPERRSSIFNGIQTRLAIAFILRPAAAKNKGNHPIFMSS